MYYIITASILLVAGGLYFVDKNNDFVVFYTLGFDEASSRRTFTPDATNNYYEAVKTLKE